MPRYDLNPVREYVETISKNRPRIAHSYFKTEWKPKFDNAVHDIDSRLTLFGPSRHGGPGRHSAILTVILIEDDNATSNNDDAAVSTTVDKSDVK